MWHGLSIIFICRTLSFLAMEEDEILRRMYAVQIKQIETGSQNMIMHDVIKSLLPSLAGT